MRSHLKRIPLTLVVTGAATIAIAVPTATADTTGSGRPSDGCTPSIRALPLPAGMVNGNVLAAFGPRAAGAVADAAGVQHVAVWVRHGHQWHVHDLGDFGFNTPEPLSATGVDARGDIAVGVNFDVVGGWLVTRSGTHQLHDFAGGTNAYVRAINANGLMVGEALDANGNDFAAVWPHWWSTPIQLSPAAGYDGSYAQGINNKGRVTGGSYSFGSLPTVATEWSRQGTPTTLPASADAEAMTLNNHHAVVGRALADPRQGLVWNGTSDPINLGLFTDSTFARALSINDHGDVVGLEGDNPAGQIPIRHVLFWPGNGPTMSLLPLSLNWADGALSDVIAPNGTVYGASSTTHDSAPVPTLWRCAAAQAFIPTANGTPANYHKPHILGLTRH